LSYTAPLFIPAVARAWLRERPPSGVYGFLTLGFLGVVLVMRPGKGLFQSAAVAALMSGFLAAVAQVGIRGLTRTEPTTRIVFYFGAVGLVLSAVPLLWRWETPPPSLWPWILILGVLATAAQLLLTTGFRYAAPARVAPFMYISVLWAALLDLALWRSFPPPLSLAGCVLICLAGGLLFRRLGAR
jgi:drug/metabolite transporter (DMT)-like permease